MTSNQSGIDLIKSFEQLRLTAYLDLRGIPTIGWGHTGQDVHLGLIIDLQAANELFQKDLSRFEQGVSQLVKITLTNGQFSALVSFSYNVGLANLKSSTLLRKVNNNQLAAAANEFLRWDHIGRQQIAGLARRREAERALFLI